MSTWLEIIDESASKFKAIATAHNLVTWAEESQFALQAIQKNDKLAQCIPHTVQNAVINVAAVGLTLNPALGYAYLVLSLKSSRKAAESNGFNAAIFACRLKAC